MSKPDSADSEVEFETDPLEAEETASDCNIRTDQEGNYTGTQSFEYVVEKVEGGLKLTRPDKVTMFMHGDSISSQVL